MEARSMENKMNLHENLIWEILLKLPVKSLIRFKCVSKSWLSLVFNVNFAKLHYEQIASHTPKLVFSKSVSIVGSSKAQIQYIDPELEEVEVHSVNLVSPFLSSLEAHDVSILGVCRGFILLGLNLEMSDYFQPHKYLLVWNPSTGIYRTLSYSEIASTLLDSLYDSIRVRYSFGYDAFTDDYFVVIAWIQNICVERFKLFSMRTNSWRQFDVPHLPCTKQWDQPAFLFVYGAIHWLAIHNYDRNELVKAIIACDLTTRNCSEIPLPHDGFVYDDVLGFEVIGGCLCLLMFGPITWQSSFAELWMMKEYKVKSSWTYVPLNATPPPCTIFRRIYRPIYLTKDGHQIVSSFEGIAKINNKGELQLTEGPEYGFVRDCHIYTESLLSLPNDSVGNA